MLERTVHRRESQRPIDVILMDGTHCEIQSKVLDVMLDNGRVLKFRRSNGWVTVGVDPVRARRRNDFCDLYYGQERRILTH